MYFAELTSTAPHTKIITLFTILHILTSKSNFYSLIFYKEDTQNSIMPKDPLPLYNFAGILICADVDVTVQRVDAALDVSYLIQVQINCC